MRGLFLVTVCLFAGICGAVYSKETPDTRFSQYEVLSGEPDCSEETEGKRSWNNASYDGIWTDDFFYSVRIGNVIREDRITEEISSVSGNFSSDIWNDKNYLIYEDHMLYFTILKDSAFSILAYDEMENTTSTIYSKPVTKKPEYANLPWGQLYLVGKYDDILVYCDGTDGNSDLVAMSVDGQEELLRIENYQGGYVTIDSDVLIVSPEESVSDGKLYAVSLENQEKIKISDCCRINRFGNYVWDHTFFYLDIEDSLGFAYDLVGFDLETMKEVQRITLEKGVWNAARGCFIGCSTNQLLLHDGTVLPFSHDFDSLYRLDDSIVYCGEDMILYQLNQDSRTWEAWVDLKDYDISFLYSQIYLTALEKTDAGIMFRYTDESLQKHAVLLL